VFTEEKITEAIRKMPEQDKIKLAAITTAQGIDLETQLIPGITNFLNKLEVLLTNNKNYEFLTR